MIARLRRPLCRCAVALGTVGFLSLAAAPAHATVSLFTTTSDFTGWSNGSAAQAASTAWDADGSTVNGAGNNPGNTGSSINVGGTSTGGSLQLTTSSNLGFNELAFSPGEAYNGAFMSAIDPGSITAFSAASSFGPGSTAAAKGTIFLTYTVPTISAGSFLQIGVNLDYAPNFYNAFFGTAVSDGTVDGLSTFTATVPYNITAGSANMNSFQLAIQSNSDNVPTSSFYVDNISVSVPEPVSGMVLATAAGGLLLKRRRRLV